MQNALLPSNELSEFYSDLACGIFVLNNEKHSIVVVQCGHGLNSGGLMQRYVILG
jgi:hypothetical protein